MGLSGETLAEIEERAAKFDDRMLPACPHGREPVDRCDVCTGEDARALLAEVRELYERLDRADQFTRETVAEAVAEEREACAKIAEAGDPLEAHDEPGGAELRIAAAIRERGAK